jgi:AcrR family transcriptional regulator
MVVADMGTSGTPETADGRKARGARNRAAIIDAARELFEQGVLDPKPAEIAERCGLSWRSVYRHFPDSAELVQAAIQSAINQVATLLEPMPPPPTLDARIDAYIALRLALVREFSPLMAATAAAIAKSARNDRPSPLRENQLATRALIHEIDLRHFSVDLDRLEPARRRAAELLLEVLSNPEWFLDRRDRGVSEAATVDEVEKLLRHTFEP